MIRLIRNYQDLAARKKPTSAAYQKLAKKLTGVRGGLFVKYGWALGGRERDPEEALARIDIAIWESVAIYPTSILTAQVRPCIYNMALTRLTPDIRKGAALLAMEVEREIPELSTVSIEEEIIEAEEEAARAARPAGEEILRRAVASGRIKPVDVQILDLHARGMKSPEIARALNMTPGKVRLRKMYALRTLQGEKKNPNREGRKKK